MTFKIDEPDESNKVRIMTYPDDVASSNRLIK